MTVTKYHHGIRLLHHGIIPTGLFAHSGSGMIATMPRAGIPEKFPEVDDTRTRGVNGPGV
jgi:hypothetical protein